ncbi:hypothetical protein [Bradyrhizobium sp. NP1]|uniref:hypothetical protein n=1 Tax=Bradyrhizobium sp. NP1 TaxID=3049772 RepID=UPI0025A574F1|nr:hypothetical protein [Bradyrhizobium sp. NP1]WJR75412.1 hypothetical protein QOU61_21695 [Bradyrhizobium sp. NP1]
MTRLELLSAGFVAAAMLATPAMAQQATQEPGAMGKEYPDANYLTGGYGVRATPGPYFYYRHRFSGPGVAIDMPYPAYVQSGPYIYVGPYRAAPGFYY